MPTTQHHQPLLQGLFLKGRQWATSPHAHGAALGMHTYLGLVAQHKHISLKSRDPSFLFFLFPCLLVPLGWNS